MAECALTELDTAQCSHCRGLDKRRPLPLIDRPVALHTMNATRGGRCPGCDDRIREGDLIGVVDGEWLCEECFQ